ncbi:MAG: NADH-dependent butanol dehydrogenase A [Brockia lithotrophica]|uniref:NADH-dependent butanol dehydrogenase A n=1 Tax=Brockia lithotrophica TaxID=933949 RepID=A0A2T5G8Z2_9BACL|nr:iron-containing alcohol dehydrogenase [Brockia lithotrophica]PTQ52598.1 MAG: NADH-dependent butanol dehydrogenase A [Brockia lithotrophica]
MERFVYRNPTELVFGRGSVDLLSEYLPRLGRKVLFVYGKGSIRRIGLYDRVVLAARTAGVELVEFPGVEPNPRISTVRRAREEARRAGVEGVLAVGGGSVVDAAKLVAVSHSYPGDPWEIVREPSRATGALPLGVVLTHAATGSEMNANSVITNEETDEKLGWAHPLAYPRFSILDPHITRSVPRDQTVYGVVDMMAHVLEQYFHDARNTPIQDAWQIALLKEILAAGRKVVENLDDLDARETLLLAGTLALNGTLSLGLRGDWGVHAIEHALSAVYDVPHGAGLAVVYPAWMRYVSRRKPERFRRLFAELFGTEDLEAGIRALETAWRELGAPVRLWQLGITDEARFSYLAQKAVAKEGSTTGRFAVLTSEDVEAIYRLAAMPLE